MAAGRASPGPERGPDRDAAGRLRQGTAVGLQDHAVLSLLARLELRGAEAADLQLDDIDWRIGEIAVTGKGSRTERLPLPAILCSASGPRANESLSQAAVRNAQDLMS